MKKLTEEEMMIVQGGVGYHWRCNDGTVSAWHLFYRTAQDNANAHMVNYPGSICSVYHG
ncbi:ComC/BlpC family peptide pheromone/bacteriocin [Streptococcus thoraltensis]